MQEKSFSDETIDFSSMFKNTQIVVPVFKL